MKPTAFQFIRVWGTAWLGALGTLLACLVLAPTIGFAETQQAVGVSPTNYVPATDAQKELQAFQELVRLRDGGTISPAEYQRLLMELAAGNKQAVRLGGPSLPQPIDPITPPVASRPISQLLLPTSKPVSPMALAYVGTRSHLPLPPRAKKNPLSTIERPSGIVHRVANKDVPQLYSIRSYTPAW